MAEDTAITKHRGHVAVFFAVLLANAAAGHSCSVTTYDDDHFMMFNCRGFADWEALRIELQEKTNQYKPNTIVIDCEHRSVYKFFIN